MRWLVAAAALSVVMTVWSSHGHACGCIQNTDARTFPRDGATQVPLNARIVIHSTFVGVPDSLRLVREIDRVDVQVSVTTKTRSSGRQAEVVLRPTLQLAANTPYVLELDYPWGTKISRFATGDEQDRTPPAYDGIRVIRFESARENEINRSSCTHENDGWHGRIIDQLGSVPDDAAYVELELFSPSDPNQIEVWLIRPRITYGGFAASSTTCAQQPPGLVPGQGWCGRATAYDLAGNTANGGRIACNAVVHCGEMYTSLEAISPCPSRAGCSGSGAHSSSAVAILILIVCWRRRRDATSIAT